ncbi:hypothetical protein [Acinetobacter sp. WCHAc060025]|uniref:hypothetical protein n=1 Tax=Acinetobacter sp. WCHAc060025 TaxID=2518625 RepID=UPI0010231A10|nr:hypothetical protein [Acinetobacter sp. WCHAc060025]RZG74466.1 hypothetical protein EXE09_12870 [Acinetobacter sp. WCHAc060025]
MKKIIVLATSVMLSATTFAAESTSQKLSTSELKAMDCATLSVEKSNAQQSLEAADKNLANINAKAQDPSAKVSKWAGIASGALSAFGKGDSKAGQLANSVAGQQDTSDASNPDIQQKLKADSQANLNNIAVYQKSKKCKI